LAAETVLALRAKVGEFLSGTSAADRRAQTLLSERALNINWGWLGRCRWQSCWRLSRRRDWVTADTDLSGETVLAFSIKIGEFLTGTSAADGGGKALLAEGALHVNRGRYGGRGWLSGGWNSRRWDRITADADLAAETVLALSAKIGVLLSWSRATDGGGKALLAEGALHVDRCRLGGDDRAGRGRSLFDDRQNLERWRRLGVKILRLGDARQSD